MSIEDNKNLVCRFYREIDAGNLDALDELVAEDYLDHSPPPNAPRIPLLRWPRRPPTSPSIQIDTSAGTATAVVLPFTSTQTMQATPFDGLLSVVLNFLSQNFFVYEPLAGRTVALTK